ncbi:uncharacterized protein LOC128963564 [Oppia nitens]|uniref:uncharacterized protein LOC128963564 n=1 Tax=Oppia nitens TaxID=1686743 RepID=UPI0023D9E138|nr:uncharacterized protein LOC128963564 [Oppia nitens]
MTMDILIMLTDIWLVELWQHRCAPYIQALKLAYSLALIFSPILVKPFLSSQTNITNNNNNNNTIIDSHNHKNGVQLSSSSSSTSKIFIPYSIAGTLILLSVLILTLLYCYRKYEPSRVASITVPDNNNDDNTNVSLNKNIVTNCLISLKRQFLLTYNTVNRSTIQLIVAVAILFSIATQLFIAPAIYFPTFAQLSHRLLIDNRSAAVMTSGLFMTMTVSRLLAIPISRYVDPQKIMLIYLSLLLGSTVIFIQLSGTSLWWLWLATILYGLGLGPINACIYSLLERLIPVTDTIGVIMLFSANILDITKYVLSIIIYVCVFFQNLPWCMFGVVINDLAEIYNTDIAGISRILQITSITSLLAILINIASKHLNKQLLYATILIIYGLSVALLPSLNWLTLMAIASILIYMINVGSYTLVNVWIVEMWDLRCGPYMQVLAMMYSLSSIAGPLMVRPFLSTKSLSSTTSGILAISFRFSQYIPRTSSDVKNNHKNSAEINTKGNPTKYQRFTRQLHHDLCPNWWTSLALLFLLGVYMLFDAIFMALGFYLPTFAQLYGGPSITQQTAALMTTGQNLAIAAVQLACIGLTKHCRPQTVLIVSLLILIGANFIYLFTNSYPGIWLATILAGIGFGPLVPCLHNLLELIIPINDTIGAIFTMLICLNYLVVPWVLGTQIASNPLIFCYVNLDFK